MPKTTNAPIPRGALAEQHYTAFSALAEEASLALAVLSRDIRDVQAGTVLCGLRLWLHRRLEEKTKACIRGLQGWEKGEPPDLNDWVEGLARVEHPTAEEVASLDAAERAAALAAEDAEANAAYEARQREKKGRGHAAE